MSRIDVFKNMVTVGGNQRIAQRLTESEFDEIVEFIEDRENLDLEKFAEEIRSRPRGGSLWVAELLWNLVHKLEYG